jgi:aspartate/methionine/tyrosine aminotransferase
MPRRKSQDPKVTFSVRIPESWIEALQDRAEQLGSDPSTIARHAIAIYLEKPHPNPLSLERRVMKLEDRIDQLLKIVTEEN